MQLIYWKSDVALFSVYWVSYSSNAEVTAAILGLVTKKTRHCVFHPAQEGLITLRIWETKHHHFWFVTWLCSAHACNFRTTCRQTGRWQYHSRPYKFPTLSVKFTRFLSFPLYLLYCCVSLHTLTAMLQRNLDFAMYKKLFRSGTECSTGNIAAVQRASQRRLPCWNAYTSQ